MSANPSQKKNWFSGTNASSSLDTRFGFGGEYFGGEKVAAGTQVDFTGSNDTIYGGVLIGNAAAVANTKIGVSGGAVIDGNDLVVGRIYPLSVVKVVANTGDVFVFKRQQ